MCGPSIEAKDWGYGDDDPKWSLFQSDLYPLRIKFLGHAFHKRFFFLCASWHRGYSLVISTNKNRPLVPKLANDLQVIFIFLRLKPFPNLSKDGLGKAYKNRPKSGRQRPGFLTIFPSTKPDLLHKSIPSPKFLEVFPKSLKNIQNHKHVPNIYPNIYPDIDPT